MQDNDYGDQDAAYFGATKQRLSRTVFDPDRLASITVPLSIVIPSYTALRRSR